MQGLSTIYLCHEAGIKYITPVIATPKNKTVLISDIRVPAVFLWGFFIPEIELNSIMESK